MAFRHIRHIVWVIFSSTGFAMCFALPVMLIDIYLMAASWGEHRPMWSVMALNVGMVIALIYHAVVWLNSRDERDE